MPMYLYQDERTGTKVEVIRSLSDSDALPTETEASEAGMIPKDYVLATWRRVIQGGISVMKGPGWGHGSKGNWIILLGVLAECLRHLNIV